MAHLRRNLVVPTPIAQAFDYLADFSTTAEWDPGISQARRIGEGPVGLGTRFRVLSEFLGREVELIYAIAEYDPPRRVVLKGGNDEIRSIDTITFKATGEGTRITYDARLTLKGVQRLADPGLQIAFEVIGRRAMAGLKQALDPRSPERRRRERLGDLLGRVLDPTIALSFDRTGFRAHGLGFRPEDLAQDMTGKICLVTGANAGIGFETSKELARRGAEVHLLCRNEERGVGALEAIRKEIDGARAHLEIVDVASLASIRAFAGRFEPRRVDVLVHNAGVLPDARTESHEGLELTVATHCVGPHLLTKLLRPKLEAAPGARVLWMSSGGMYARRLDLHDFQWKRRAYDGVTAYAQTKRAQVILSEMWAHHLRHSRIVSHAMHPGWADTGSVRASLPRFWKLTRRILRTPAEGADTAVWLAVCPRVQDTSGLFWFDRAPRPTHLVPWTRESKRDRTRLWELVDAWADLGA
ncbi:MAG: SDR family NAD(P)-dependent oxidoreductase [Myxococcales bacterium]|nr:SDR family NAD(P)-dependent oxidoreductase [Myxococcales bacterium]